MRLHLAAHVHVQKAVSLTVGQEGAKLAGVDVMVEGDEEVLVELEGGGKLDRHLIHTVQELCEDWRRVTNIAR